MTPASGPGWQVEPLAEGALFRLARPDKHNAITRPMLLALADCVTALEAEGARVLIVTGEGGRAFCAGTDLAETRESPQQQRLDKSQMARELFARIARAPFLSVAAVNGLAFGGGAEIAMACTMRVAAAHARFSLPEIKLGLLPAYGGTQFLVSLVGRARALDLMLTGRVIDAREALAIGLVDRVIDPGADVLEAARALASEITRFSPQAIAGIRRCVSAAGLEVTDAGLAVEDAVVRSVFTSEDAREGVAAFLEKRPAVFRGR